ncbi:MAG: GTPase-associated system all-helical protein GASH [Tepidisphaeraceae bacterium]
MSEQDLLSSNLPRWLENVGVQLDNERMPLYVGAVESMSVDLDGRELAVVRGAHGIISDELRRWLGAKMREHDSAFVGENKDALLSRLAASSVTHALTSAVSSPTILVNLATESARFVGLTPAISDLHAVSEHALAETAKSVRERVQPSLSPAPRVASERRPDAETGAIAVEDVARDVGTHARVLKTLSGDLQTLSQALTHNGSVTDEEVEILWWVLSGRSTLRALEQDQTPVGRAIRASLELMSRTQRLPGPPATRFFLSQVLDVEDGEEVTIAEIARAGAEIRELPSGGDSLVPIASAVAAYREVDGRPDLWEGLAESKYGVEIGRSVSLVEAAEQLYLELGILELLQQ